MYQRSSGSRIVAMLIAAAGLTFLAAALAVGALGAPVATAAFELVMALGSFVLANYVFQAAVALRDAEREARRLKPVPIRVRARERR